MEKIYKITIAICWIVTLVIGCLIITQVAKMISNEIMGEPTTWLTFVIIVPVSYFWGGVLAWVAHKISF